MFKDRTENTDKFSEIAKKFGENDIRFGQAIFNYARTIAKEDKDLFVIENDEFEAGLLAEVERLEKGEYT